MINYLGEMSLAASMPGASAAASAGIAGINGALPDIEARIAALQAFTPTEVNFQAQLQLAQSILASVEHTIALGLPAPSIAVQISLVTALINVLLVAVENVEAALSVVVTFQSLLTFGGVHALAYDGPAASLGTEIDGALAPVIPGITHSNAVALVTTDPSTWDAMNIIFKVSP